MPSMARPSTGKIPPACHCGTSGSRGDAAKADAVVADAEGCASSAFSARSSDVTRCSSAQRRRSARSRRAFRLSTGPGGSLGPAGSLAPGKSLMLSTPSRAAWALISGGWRGQALLRPWRQQLHQHPQEQEGKDGEGDGRQQSFACGQRAFCRWCSQGNSSENSCPPITTFQRMAKTLMRDQQSAGGT